MIALFRDVEGCGGENALKSPVSGCWFQRCFFFCLGVVFLLHFSWSMFCFENWLKLPQFEHVVDKYILMIDNDTMIIINHDS